MAELKVSVETRTGLERRIKVCVPADRIETQVNEKLREVGRSAKLKGFRPGKVPPKIIEQHYGGQVRQEVLQQIVDSSYGEAINQEKFKPVGMPTIEPDALETGKDFTYTATFEIYPEIKLNGLDGMKIERPLTEIRDEDLDEMLESLRKQRVSWSPVDRKAVDGDRVTVDFEGKLDGEVIENGRGEKFPVILGEGQMLADFEKNLVGMTPGGEKNFKVKFPKDYPTESLAGKKVDFSASVSEVAEPQLPDLDEEFIKAFGVESGNLEELRADVRRNMERETETRITARIKQQVMDQLVAANPIDLPAALVENEAAGLRAEAARNMGLSDPQQAPPLGEFMQDAERRVRLGLLVGAVIEDNKLTVDRDRVKRKVDEFSAPYENPEEMRKLYFQNQQLMSQVESIVMEEQVVDLLISRAKVTDKDTVFSELMNG